MEQIKSYQKRGIGGLNYMFYKDEFYGRFFTELFDSYQPGMPMPIHTDQLLEKSRSAQLQHPF